MSKIKSYISGIGHYVPDKIVTNNDLSNLMDTSDEWITERTGIKERRYASEGMGPSDLAIPAVEEALSNAGVNISFSPAKLGQTMLEAMQKKNN